MRNELCHPDRSDLVFSFAPLFGAPGREAEGRIIAPDAAVLAPRDCACRRLKALHVILSASDQVARGISIANTATTTADRPTVPHTTPLNRRIPSRISSSFIREYPSINPGLAGRVRKYPDIP